MVFRFNNINLSKANGYLKVTMTGYFTGSRTFVTTAGRTHTVRIRLLPKTTTGTFAASAGGTVTLETGGKLVMPAKYIQGKTITMHSKKLKGCLLAAFFILTLDTMFC